MQSFSSGTERTLDAVERIRIVRVDRPEAGASGLSTLPIRRDSTRPGFWIGGRRSTQKLSLLSWHSLHRGSSTVLERVNSIPVLVLLSYFLQIQI